MINLHWLKTFCTLADIGHFTKTADVLFMTQSGVSQHIKKLEQQLAVTLLLREGKSFTLSDEGLRLYQQGKLLLEKSDDLAQSIKQDDAHIGNIRVASPGSIGLKLYPQLLAILQQQPKLSLDYTFAPNHSIELALIERNIDIGLVTKKPQDHRINSTAIGVEPLVLVTPAAVSQVTWPVLNELGFINHPDAAHHANLLLQKNFTEFSHINQFQHKGFSNQISLILAPVSLGLGFTVLPLYAALAFHQQSLINIHHLAEIINEPLYICHNQYSYKAQRINFISNEIIKHIANDACFEVPRSLHSD
ncbi:LysR family transcriptional regulator [Cognaticolwellia aestuarii]|uniref:LysR family transcriptional regulator n=1 Tax=Cognaticolwellia aestuarii TaxID=329993 RepID=UPI0009861AD0|nr:LysR family transcriptional regulator [Cognaticolwellia aestuarii]